MADATSSAVGVVVGGDEPHDGAVVVEVGRLGADRRRPGRMPVPSLPVDSAMSCSAQSPKPTFSVPASTSDELVAQRLGAGHRGAQAQRRVGVVVGGEQVGDRLGVVEQRLDVGAGQAARHQPERGERGVAPADVRVGVDDAVAGRAGVAVERAAGVGHDDDARGRVDAGVA